MLKNQTLSVLILISELYLGWVTVPFRNESDKIMLVLQISYTLTRVQNKVLSEPSHGVIKPPNYFSEQRSFNEFVL